MCAHRTGRNVSGMDVNAVLSENERLNLAIVALKPKYNPERPDEYARQYYRYRYHTDPEFRAKAAERQRRFEARKKTTKKAKKATQSGDSGGSQTYYEQNREARLHYQAVYRLRTKYESLVSKPSMSPQKRQRLANARFRLVRGAEAKALGIKTFSDLYA